MSNSRSSAKLWSAGTGVALLLSIFAPHERAAHAKAPPGRYEAGKDVDGTEWVLDRLTGLQWKRNVEGANSTFDWATAMSRCNAPWRPPALLELQSLVDETNTSPPAIDGSYFPTTIGMPMWSSTTLSLNTLYAWEVHFGNGISQYNLKTDAAVAGVRCVKP